MKKKFSAKPSKRPGRPPGTGFTTSKPAGSKPAPRRPFAGPPREGDEEQAPSRSFGGRPFAGRSQTDDRPAFGGRPYAGKPAAGDRPSFRGKPGFGPKPAFGDNPGFGPNPSFGDKPTHGPRPGFGGKPAYGARPGFGDKPAYGARPAFGGKPPYGAKPSFGARIPAAAAGRPFMAREEQAEDRSRRYESEDQEAPVRRSPRRVVLNFDDLIYGVHAVEEALRAGETIVNLHVGLGRERDPVVFELCEAARRLGVPIRTEGSEFFANIPYKAHQSIIAVGEPYKYITLEEAIAVRDTDRLIVVMDHLTDPHNVGAILRTAECAGAQAAVLPDRRSAGVNATVRKVAAGATSHMPVAKVGNLSQTIRTLKENGFTVVGAAIDETARPLTAVDFKGDIALVIGAEGEGLSRLVSRSCDVLATIPIKGKVESLNASVAAGVLLYEVVRQREMTID